MKKEINILAELFAQIFGIYVSSKPITKKAIEESIFIINHTVNQKEKQDAIFILNSLLFDRKDL